MVGNDFVLLTGKPQEVSQALRDLAIRYERIADIIASYSFMYRSGTTLPQKQMARDSRL